MINNYIITTENESLQKIVISKNEQVEELQSILEMKEERMKELESSQERNHVLLCSYHNFMKYLFYRNYDATNNNYQ